MTGTKVAQGQREDIGAQCEFCAGRSFRRSHLQFKDVLPVLLFRYPVRCLSCSKRQSVSLLVAQRAVPSTVKQVRASRSETRLSGWNSADREESGAVPVGADGHNFSALPVRAPISMPELKGVMLKHVDAAASDESPV